MKKATVVLAAVLGTAGLAACGAPDRAAVEPTTTVAAPTTTTAPQDPAVATTTTTSTPPSTTTTTTAPVPPTLASGDEGPMVRELQVQLSALGYWLGEPDGVFGADTVHAVTALQKAAGLDRTGEFDEATRNALAAGSVPSPTSTAGRVVEIDLQRQLFLVVTDGVVDRILDTSTGSRPGLTPLGTFRVEREIDGFRRSRLGLLYRPKYFYLGVALHGSTSVPTYPASHGCVRLTYAATDALWAEDLIPIGTTVVVR